MTQLVRYEAACKAVSEARTIDEAKAIHNQAEAMRAYARQAKNRQLEVDAAEIRMRAERRLGEILAAAKNAGQIQTGRPEKKNGSNEEPFNNGSNEEPFQRVTLSEVGIDKKLSHRAQALAAVPEPQFEAMVTDWRERVQQENERVTTNLLRAGERAQRDSGLDPPPLPEGKYSLIYADPPWRYEHAKTESRRIENQYPTMELEEICGLPVHQAAADDCVLFLWTTSPKLAESMKVIDAWGFEYRTCAIWDKEVIGMGYYFRQQHELLLVAARGQPGTPEAGDRVGSIIRKRRGEHSAKPVEFYELIESMYPHAVKLEMFARQSREGWHSWGNQVAA